MITVGSSKSSTSDLEMCTEADGSDFTQPIVIEILSSDFSEDNHPSRSHHCVAVTSKGRNCQAMETNRSESPSENEIGCAAKYRKQSRSKESRSIFSTSDSEFGPSPTKKRPTRRSATGTAGSDSELSKHGKTVYLHGNVNIPIFEKSNTHYSAKRIVEVLLDETLPDRKIATSQPVCVEDNLVFVVDLSKLDNPNDIRCDDLGSWTCNGKRMTCCEVENGEVTEISKRKRGPCSYTLIKRYYKHATAGDFKRIIAELIDPSGDKLNRAFVQYSFTNSPHPILQKPHGNSKGDNPFVRTTPSTLQKLKECSKSMNPKEAVSTVSKEKGRIVKANAVGDIPRNRKQLYNIKSKVKSSQCSDDDALLSVMAMCKESVGKNDDPFVRIVTSAPEPMCVLSSNSQLKGVERFCTNSFLFTPLVVDPTFDLGDFSVTVTSFRNLLLKSCKTNKHPTMLGPMLIHRRKIFTTYHFFASTLVSLCPTLSQLKAFGTDGEESLYKAFSLQFHEAKHLRCFLHFRDNCKFKLREMNVSDHVSTNIIQDILGSGLKGREGLVDAENATELMSRLQSLESKWEALAPGFYKWFLEFKVSDLEMSMLSSVRRMSGLGDPPEPFYTNDVESMNRVIKQKTNYKTQEWPEFCRLARQLADEQENEIEKAVLGIGEYRFDEHFKYLQISLGRWSSMSQGQRRKHLNKIHEISMQQESTPPGEVSRKGDSAASSSSCFTVNNEWFDASSCQLSNDILRNMFTMQGRTISCRWFKFNLPITRICECQISYEQLRTTTPLCCEEVIT